MTKEKQIEEMGAVLEKAKIEANATIGSMNNGFGAWYAQSLYNAGYRKQSEGEWIDVPSYGSGFTLRGERVFPKQCSNCGNIFAYAPYPYCPKCGAKMKGGDE